LNGGTEMSRKLFTTVVGSLAAACLMAVVWAAPVTTSAAAGPAGASFGVAPSAGMTNTSGVTDSTSITDFGESMIASAIAAHFGVSVADVLAVRNQDMGWGEVFKVLYLAQVSGKKVDEILALREDEGWGVIAKFFGLHPGLGKNNLGQTLKEQRAASTPTAAPTSNATNDKKLKDKAPEVNLGNASHANSNNGNQTHGKLDNPGNDKGHGH
jgi:hypothetical protein